jgi:hypothetical protein
VAQVVKNVQTFDAIELPEDIQINGRVMALYGSGWFGIDPAIRGRWGQDSAQLLIFSPRKQHVELRSCMLALDVPADTCAATPVLKLRTPHQQQTTPAVPDTDLQTRLLLNEGWTIVTFELALPCAETTHPPLSFALDTIQIRSVEHP